MLTGIDKILQSGCEREKKEKICRSRGGESCAFDGAMIVLQPIADAAHIVHGPIACCGNSWEGRGAFSSKGRLHSMGFTTDMSEMDIVYGSEDKLHEAILKTYELVKPRAIFVHATCVSGLTGEDIGAVAKKTGKALGIRVIPVHAPGFAGPKNLGNRIAGEVLLDYVIGTGEPVSSTDYDINLIGEYNIAGDLWQVEPVLRDAGISILSRITGNASFDEITYAHRAKLNVVVCSRALINIAREMKRKYGIPYIEVSFFGKTEMSKALRMMAQNLELMGKKSGTADKAEKIIEREEKQLDEKLNSYEHLKGKRAVLYTGGVKSWSFISALLDLGIETVAVGTRKSTAEDEEKMKEILGKDAPLVEDVTPGNLLRLLKDRKADILVAGGRNQYLAIKEGYPFVDVNQERHTAYAGYNGLVNLAEQISSSMHFFEGMNRKGYRILNRTNHASSLVHHQSKSIVINPLKHSQAIGAAIAFQGVDKALPVIHGAQGCTFLGKVLLTKHFREPVALAGTKLFTEEVVMGSDEKLRETATGFAEKNRPDVIGILTTGLSEVKGDDVSAVVKQLQSSHPQCNIIYVPTPDFEGGLETGYAKAVEALLQLAVHGNRFAEKHINVFAGSHLAPADVMELRGIIESFGLKPIILPDLSALDGSRQGFSALAAGGLTADEIRAMGSSAFSIAIGSSLEGAASMLKDRFGIEYRIFESISGLKGTDMLIETLSMLGSRAIPEKIERQRMVLVDGMKDAHFYYGNKKVCLALENDLLLQTSSWLNEMGADIEAVDANSKDLFSIKGDFDLLISNSHAEETAKRLGVPLYQMGFPVYKILGNSHKVTIGYKGTLFLINDTANAMM